ncbi:sigma-54-dependent transcriptional regulator [Nitrospira sp. Kam-Ns4a]
MNDARARNGLILIVDDAPDILTVLQDRLGALGFDTIIAEDGPRALELLDREAPSLMLLDIEMPGCSGLDVLRRLSQAGGGRPELPVIVMTAHGTITRAVEAMKAGAVDFITKPLEGDHLELAIRRAQEQESLRRQVDYLRGESAARYQQIVGTSPALRSVVELAQRAAQSCAGVLLLGESGTGKELFARMIHQWSPRRAQPFVVINCVALTETLLENELFGHEKGAFTGADRLQKGKLEVAHGGTVFLDEIGDMPQALQTKLLRVLQDQTFTRVGGTRPVRVNLRVIAATNRNLPEAVKARQFREDLFFRLNVVTLTLPPLRERQEDIPHLAEFFLKRSAREAKRLELRLTKSALDALVRHPWPGNIRELENAIARAVVLCPEQTIGPEHLGLATAQALARRDAGQPAADRDLPYHEAMEQYSRTIILKALERAGGSRLKAAQALGLQPTYLSRLIRKKNLAPKLPVDPFTG